MKPLAIVGIGCLFPKANNPEEYWRNIREGFDAIGDIPETHWKVSDYFNEDKSTPDMTYAKRGGFIDPVDFNPLLYGLSPNNIEATDTTQLLGMVVAREALLDAGYSTGKDAGDGREFDRDRTSVVLGVTGTLELVIPLGARLGHPIWRKALNDAGIDKETAEDIVQRIADGYVPWQENSFPGLLGNVAAGRIANRFDLGGTNCVVDAACASSLSAIHLAALELSAGRVDMAITGGMDTFNDIFMYMCFSKTPALSPTGNSRPFAKNGDGTILGEGLGAVVMKRLEDAKRDGDKIYAVLKGMGSSSDGRGNAIYAPSSDGQTKALWNAYREADVAPRSIELVEAHGTGTSVGDAVEARALSGVYSKDNEGETWCAIGSVKSMIGHTKAAAGVAGLIKTAMALKHKVLPPSIKVDEPLEIINPGEAPIYLNTIKRPWLKQLETPRRAALSSFGFGGSNFHCVLEEAEETKTDIEWDGHVLILPVAADNQADLIKQLPDEKIYDSWNDLRFFAFDACQKYDYKKIHRLVLIVEKSKTDIIKLIADVKQKLSSLDASEWQLPNAFYATGNESNKVAFVFPGQGSQYIGMGRDIACQFPQFFNLLQRANDAYVEASDGHSLSAIMYPIPVFNRADRKLQEDTLRQTQYAQPAIGATSLGYLDVLKHFNVSATAAVGHSFGELTALHAAGYYDEDAFHYLSFKRGELMAKGEGDRGSMLAAMASSDKVELLLKQNNINLLIANYNSPEQIVLSGATGQVESFTRIAKREKIRAIRLPVAAAFHSEYVADAVKPFSRIVNKIQFKKNSYPVLSNTTTKPYPDDVASQKKLLSEQLAKPVHFVEQIQQLYKDGFKTFIEVGPGRTLSGLIGTILLDKTHHAASVDASAGKQSGQLDLAKVLGLLASQGQPVALSNWDAACKELRQPEEGKPAMTVPVNGANIMKERPARPPLEKKYVMTEKPPIKQIETQQINQASLSNASPILEATQQSILALQKMQEQTVRLHQQYLEGQETAQKTIHALLQQQQALMSGQPVTENTSIKLPEIPKVTLAAKMFTESKIEQQDVAIHQPVQKQVSKQHDVDIDNLLLKVVSDKTGYPLEMLSLDMSLDTDLGIDSIKRVEILSALQEQLPWSPVIKPEELGTFQFLQHIVEFIVDGKPEAAEPGANITPVNNNVSIESNTAFDETLLNIVSDKTGYPIDMLELDMNLDSDLGIDSIKRVEILSSLQEAMPELPTISPDELSQLQTLRSITMLFTNEASVISPAVSTVAINNDGFANTLMEVVANKTGYPVDMLNLDMNLDSDLGIDSIKRVEILSAIQEKMPELPSVDPDAMASLQTLLSIVEHFGAVDSVSVTQQVVKQVTEDSSELESVLLEVVADKTGYPVDMLNLDMNLDSDLGIDSIKRVEILSALQDKLPDLPAVSPEELSALQTLQQIIETMSDQVIPVAIHAENNVRNVTEDVVDVVVLDNVVRHIVDIKSSHKDALIPVSLNADKPILIVGNKLAEKISIEIINNGYQTQVIGLNDSFDNDLSGLVICGEAIKNKDDLLTAFALIQKYADVLQRNKGILASVTEMGGKFGFESIKLDNQLQAALPGIIKTADKEWPDTNCICIDAKDADMSLLVDTILSRGKLEIGIQETNLFEFNVSEKSIETIDNKKLFGKDDLIVISGGAKGVTAVIAIKLAETYQCQLLLLGRSPEPETEPEWLTGLSSESEIKQSLLKLAEKKLTPVELENQYHAVTSNREILQTMKLIADEGGHAEYRSVDITDAEKVAKTIDLARLEMKNVTGIIHAAGILADRLIVDKTAEQFEKVLNTKVAGFNNLLTATANDQLKLIVNFSSTTARLGRKGQVDYAAANEVLNKSSQLEKTKRPECRVLSINWGPWDGGMVTPGLKKLFAEEGVSVIGLKAGANYFIDEIENNDSVETVVLGGALTNDSQVINNTAPVESPNLSLAFERELTINSYQFLQSHVMNGRAVLPVAVIVEWFAHGALHLNPGMQFVGFEDFRVLKGVTLNANESVRLRILSGSIQYQGQDGKVQVELHSGNYLHATAKIVLSDVRIKAPETVLTPVNEPYGLGQGEYYENGQLFHGQHLQGIKAINFCNEDGIVADVNAAPEPSAWMQQPIRSNWITDPLILDSAFQAMIIWSFEHKGNGSLPTEIKYYRQYQKQFPKQGVRIVASVKQYTDYKAISDIEFVDKSCKLVASMKGYQCVIDSSLHKAFKNNDLTLEV